MMLKNFVKLDMVLIFLNFYTKIKGESAHPLYKWISGNTSVIGQPRWNFHKYLIRKEGQSS